MTENHLEIGSIQPPNLVPRRFVQRTILVCLVLFSANRLASPGDSPAAVREPECGKQCLTALIDRYLDALVKHDPKLLPLEGALRFTQNGEPLALGEGLWKTAAGIKYRQYFSDPASGNAAFFGVVDEGGQLAIFALRLKVRKHKIAEVETIVSHKGDHALFSPESLVMPKPIYDEAVAPAQRSSREKMIAVANSYFDGIEQHNGDVVPFHPDCNRTENGIRTTNNPARGFNSGCQAGLNRIVYIPKVRDRRFPIVDEERGLVLSFIVFDMPGNIQTAVIDGRTVELTESQLRKRSLVLAELFKIVDGKIREIEAFMINRPLGAPSGWPN